MLRSSHLRAGVVSAVGDAAHLLQNFAVEAAQEQRIGGGAVVRPRSARRPCLPVRRRSAPGIRGSRAPSGGRAGSRARTACLRCADRSTRRPDSDRRGRRSARPRAPASFRRPKLRRGYAFEPRFALERAAIAGGEQMLILRSAWRRIRSESRVQPCVPPSDAECTSNGMDAMVSAAPERWANGSDR